MIVKMEAPITKFQASRRRDSNIEALILIGVTVVLAIVIAIVVIMMVKFCGGLWLRPLSQDLFSPRVTFCDNVNKRPIPRAFALTTVFLC